MSASSRTQRATVYPYVGASTGGFVESTYGAARGTYWCRLSPIPGEQSIIDAQIGSEARAVIEFADEVPVAEHDLIVVDGVQWKAGPPTERKQQRAKVVRVSRALEAVDLL